MPERTTQLLAKRAVPALIPNRYAHVYEQRDSRIHYLLDEAKRKNRLERRATRPSPDIPPARRSASVFAAAARAACCADATQICPG